MQTRSLKEQKNLNGSTANKFYELLNIYYGAYIDDRGKDNATRA